MATVPELMRSNLLDVFNERDDERRRAAVARTYTADVTFVDPDEVVVGRAALDEKARGLQEMSPGLVFTPGGPVLVNHDLGHLAWNLGPEGGKPVVRGIDIALVENGLIARLYTILTQVPA